MANTGSSDQHGVEEPGRTASDVQTQDGGSFRIDANLQYGDPGVLTQLSNSETTQVYVDIGYGHNAGLSDSDKGEFAPRICSPVSAAESADTGDAADTGDKWVHAARRGLHGDVGPPVRGDSRNALVGNARNLLESDSNNILTGWSRKPGSFRSENLAVSIGSLSFLLRSPSIEDSDEGKGYEQWLRADPLSGWQIPLTTARVLVEKVIICTICCVPAGVFCYLFSLLVKEAVHEWRIHGITPLQENPFIAGMIGEPFHELNPTLIYSTFAALQLLCPILCCQTKMIGQLVLMHGRKVLPVWRISAGAGIAIVVLHMACAAIMHGTGKHIPRIGWMSIIFVNLFAGLFLTARATSKIIHFPGFTFLFFRAAFVSNVLLYLYAVFYPFWFFSTDSLVIKGFLAIVVTPSIEYGVYFLHQHTAIHYRHNDPNKAVYPCVHYSTLFALYGNFLLVSFPEPWQNLISLTLVRLFGVMCQVFAQELTYATYRIVLCMPKEDVIELLRTLRFKAFKHNMINLQTIHRCFATVVAGLVTFYFRFDISAPGSSTGPKVPSTGWTAAVVFIQIGITLGAAFITDCALAWRKTKWHAAWTHRDEMSSAKLLWIYLVSAGMFLFYFYPFLAQRYVLPQDEKPVPAP